MIVYLYNQKHGTWAPVKPGPDKELTTKQINRAAKILCPGGCCGDTMGRCDPPQLHYWPGGGRIVYLYGRIGAERLGALKGKLKLSDTELARGVGISRSQCQKILAGKAVLNPEHLEWLVSLEEIDTRKAFLKAIDW